MDKYTIPQCEGGGRNSAKYRTYRSEEGRLGARGGWGKSSSGLTFEPALSNGSERIAKGKHRREMGSGDPERDRGDEAK